MRLFELSIEDVNKEDYCVWYQGNRIAYIKFIKNDAELKARCFAVKLIGDDTILERLWVPYTKTTVFEKFALDSTRINALNRLLRALDEELTNRNPIKHYIMKEISNETSE